MAIRIMPTVSPHQVARALGASESSLKRWCDQGLLATTRTAGGHRRLSIDAVTEFLRRTSRRPVRPELLGLPALRSGGARTLAEAAEDFFQGLLENDEETCRRIVFDLYLAGQRISQICDSVIAEAFRRVGQAWECGQAQVYQERRGCELCARLLSEVRALIPIAGHDAPLAIGGTPECDPYTLPTAMVELAMRQLGWQAQSLGARLPWNTLLGAIHDLRPRVLWLSVSHVDDEPAFVEAYRAFYEQVPTGVAVVIGGRALGETLRRQIKYAAYCDNLQHLEAFTKALAPVRKAPKSPQKRTTIDGKKPRRPSGK